MASSPLPKRGSFSNLFSLSPHKRTFSCKSQKAFPLRPTPAAPILSDSEISISTLKDQIINLTEKNLSLKEKIRTLESQISSQTSQKNQFEETKKSFVQLVEVLFKCIDDIFSFSLDFVRLDNFELKLLEEFQDFQKTTKINTSGFIQKIMKWRHSFNDELLSPAGSVKHGEVSNKKMTKSVSSMIASTVKVYGVCLQDFISINPDQLSFSKGEIVEITEISQKFCQGKIGDREGVFPKDLVKFV